jgi:hypothetical protein
MLPHTRGNGRDVTGMALCPMLEVVAAYERWPVGSGIVVMIASAPRLPLRSNSPCGTAARDGSTRHTEHHSVLRRLWTATHPLAVTHYHIKIARYKIQKRSTGKDVGPICAFVVSPRVGPGGVVDTLKTGYPHMQALCQDEGQDGQLQNRHVSRGSSSRLPTQYSSRAATCLMAPTPTSWLRAAPEPPRVP